MTKHTATLQDRLARSLDLANRREAAKPKAPLPPKLPEERRCVKLSISLFTADMARLDAILALMAQNGERCSTSQAVKLALRTAPLDLAALRQALAAIRAEDGRRW